MAKGDPGRGSVLSVDLASRRYRDIGVTLLHPGADQIAVEVVRLAGLGLSGTPDTVHLTEVLLELARRAAARVILLDGPQGWKHPNTPLVHQRVCELALATPGKTGLPRVVKPASWTRMAEFSMAVFDRLDAAGWRRLGSDGHPGTEPVAVESFPTAAWRMLGLPALPARGRSAAQTVPTWRIRLQALLPLRFSIEPTHDELQAAVAGLAGLGMAGHPLLAWSCHGLPPVQEAGDWYEGYIACPVLTLSGRSQAPP